MSRVFYENWKLKFKNISRTDPSKLTISRIFQEPLTIQELFKEFKELKNRWPPCFSFLSTLFRFKRKNRSGIIYDVIWMMCNCAHIRSRTHTHTHTHTHAHTHTHHYLFRCAIIAHAILCTRSQHFNKCVGHPPYEVHLSSIYLLLFTVYRLAFTVFWTSQRKSIM